MFDDFCMGKSHFNHTTWGGVGRRMFVFFYFLREGEKKRKRRKNTMTE